MKPALVGEAEPSRPTAVSPRRFFLIRHGETDWNREGRLQGQRDVLLNGRGRDQAAAAGRTLRDLLVSHGLSPENLHFVSSPLRRASETMERLRGAMGLAPARYALDGRLCEIAFGAWEGMTWPEVKHADARRYRERKSAKWTFVPPGGESYADVALRLRPWLAGLGEDSVVVAHGGVARAILTETAGLPTGRAADVEIVQGRVLSISGGETRWH